PQTVMARVRIAVGRCVSVQDPGKAAIVTHHNIWIRIEGKEWRELCDAFANITPEKHVALRAHIVAEGKRCDIVAGDRKQQPPAEAAHHDPARSLIRIKS